MQKGTIFLTLVAIGIAFLVWLLPERPEKTELSPKELLLAIKDETRFLSTDEVATMIIGQDPSLQLIDVRDPDDYTKFHLPGAINIPLEKILDEQNLELIGAEEQQHVFYSNGTIRANQAWVLTRRLGYGNTYIMKGGLNRWVETIMIPPVPPSSAPSEAFDQYDFRLSACRYFQGGKATAPVKKQTPVKVVPRRKKKVTASGGC